MTGCLALCPMTGRKYLDFGGEASKGSDLGSEAEVHWPGRILILGAGIGLVQRRC